MPTSWKDQFNPRNFLPYHHQPGVFVISKWQPDKETPSFLYLFLRLAIFVTFFVVWILSYTMETPDGKPRWPIYLTNWGMTLCVLQSFFACLMLTCVVIGTRLFDSPKLVDRVLNCYKVYWVINVMAVTLAFTISLIFWTVIYPATNYYWSAMNFMVHGANSIVMFIDLCIVSHPVRVLHFIYPILIALVYTIMTAIFYALGGTAKGGSKYIYPILKWDEPGETIGYCAGIMVLMLIIHTLTFLVYLAKMKIARYFGIDDELSPSEYEPAKRMTV